MDETAFPRITLVLGGASSGKTAWAERLVQGSGRAPVYLATGRPTDAEMAEKIARHRAARGVSWRTLEAPLDAAGALAGAEPGSCVLLDCATFWLSNHMEAGSDIAAQTEALLDALRACPAPVVVVSNEVGQGIVPGNALARAFRMEQGALNIRLAEAADLAVLITAGLPLVLKGRLPGGA